MVRKATAHYYQWHRRKGESKITRSKEFYKNGHVSLSAISDVQQTSMLLTKLPGEIRNKIWSYTFKYTNYVQYGKRIDIDYWTDFPRMTVAAKVCRQMLNEVLGVFLNEVDFVITIEDCRDHIDIPAKAKYMRLCTLQRSIGHVETAPFRLGDAPKAPKHRLVGRPVFGNAKSWACSVHGSHLDLLYETGGYEGTWVEDLFDMLNYAIAMRHRPWKEVRKIMFEMREEAGKRNADWLSTGHEVRVLMRAGQW